MIFFNFFTPRVHVQGGYKQIAFFLSFCLSVEKMVDWYLAGISPTEGGGGRRVGGRGEGEGG